ncbi:hypothetical protein Tco_0074153 [Tanacetum coccineum]
MKKQHGVNIMALEVANLVFLFFLVALTWPGRRCYGCCEESKGVELKKTLDVTKVKVGCSGKVKSGDGSKEVQLQIYIVQIKLGVLGCESSQHSYAAVVPLLIFVPLGLLIYVFFVLFAFTR